MRISAVQSTYVKRLVLFAASVAAAFVWLRFQFPGYLSHFFSAIPGEVWGAPTKIGGEGRHYYGGDQVQILYLSWKLKQNLINHWSILTDRFTFAAHGGVHHDLCVGPQFWLIALLSLLFGDVAAYNLGFVVLPLCFTFLAGYYLFAAATSSVLVRVLLAAGLTVVPLRVVEMMMGHSTGVIFCAVPLYWGVVLRHRLQTGLRYGDALAGLILFSTVVAEEHQGLYLLITSAMVGLVWLLQDAWPLRQSHRAVGRLLWRWKYLLVGLIAVVGWGTYYHHAILVDSVGQPRFERPAWDIKLYSQPLRSFVGMDGESNVGAWLIRALGVAIVVLAICGRERWKRLARSPYLGFALSLPVLLLLTVGLGPDWSQRTGVYEWFYAHVPFFSAQRVSIKMFTVCATFLALLCAAVFQVTADEWRAVGRARGTPRALALGLALSLLLGAIVLQPIQYISGIAKRWPGLQLTDMHWGPTHLFFYVRSHLSKGDIILTVPFDIKKSRWETYPDYLAFRAHARFADGYFGLHPRYFDAVAGEIATFNDGAPTARARQLAKDLGYTYLLLNKDQWPLRTPDVVVQSRFDSAPWLGRVICDGDFCLYALR